VELPPGLLKFLDSMGVNTARLRWKLYEWEKRRETPKERGLPIGLRWMKYQHKFCPNCNGLVDRRETHCPACEAKVPSMGLYRVLRTIGLVIPQGGAATVMSFIGLIVLFYLLTIIKQGPSAIMSPTYGTLYIFGMMFPETIVEGGWWRLLSFGLLHAGLLHIGFNSMALVQVGPPLEDQLGSKRMLVLVTVTQLTSAFAVQIWGSGAVGASGWLFGLLGFGLLFFHRQGRLEVRNFFVQWAIYGFAFGFLLGFNNTAHAGGFVGGALLGLIADLTPARRHPLAWVWSVLFWPSLLAWAATLVMMFRSILNNW
jgi:rhomboid protease GluP